MPISTRKRGLERAVLSAVSQTHVATHQRLVAGAFRIVLFVSM